MPHCPVFVCLCKVHPYAVMPLEEKTKRKQRALLCPYNFCRAWLSSGDFQGLYTPPDILVGLQMDSGRHQMDFCFSSTIFSIFFLFGGNPAKCLHLDFSWSPGPPSGLHGLHLITQSTSQTPYGVHQESTRSLQYLVIYYCYY